LARDVDIAMINTGLAGCREFLWDHPPKNHRYSFGAGFCVGVVSGLIQANTMQPTGGTPPLFFCPPGSATLEQDVCTVVDYAARHPEPYLSLEILAYDALHEAWPCKPRSSPHTKEGR